MPTPMKLTLFRGPQQLGEYRFEQDILKIGRMPSAHVLLNTPEIGGFHAVIESSFDGTQCNVIDMGTDLGTMLNGRRISKERLRSGDELRFGEFRVIVQFDLPAPKMAQPSAVWGDLLAPEESEIPTAIGPSPFLPSTASATAVHQIPVLAAPVMTAQAVAAPVLATPAPLPRVPVEVSPAQAPRAMPVLPEISSNPFAPSATSEGLRSASHAVDTNLASADDPDTARALEIRTIWGDTVLDTVCATTQPAVTMGDERRFAGFGPFTKLLRSDIEIPTRGLAAATFPLAQSLGADATNYAINIPDGFEAYLVTRGGKKIQLAELKAHGRRGLESSEVHGAKSYTLQADETLFLERKDIRLQLRYVRKGRPMPLGIVEQINPVWANTLLLVFFVHLMGIISFLTMPSANMMSADELFKNPNRFAQYRLTPEEKKRIRDNALAKLKAGGDAGAKAKGQEGKAGRKDYDPKKKQGRMAIKGDPSSKDLAKSMLSSMFGVKGNVRRSYLFGTGGLGGELKGALGGVMGAEIGDATGLGGLGVRGDGPGGGGLSTDSVGIGALGTRGRGAGGSGGGTGSGYGDGAGSMGRKAERDINITAGSPVVVGSLDKELIRKVIRDHIAQIRYCYEVELQRSPGLYGKVATEFTIGADGSVQSASATENSLNGAAAQCMLSKIRTWRFPEPKGGGVVIVKYPFLFKDSG